MRKLLNILNLLIILLVVDCPDPCLMAGHACNDDSDCSADEHCIAPGAGELSCLLVKGNCADKRRCHRREDCGEEECCDLVHQVCAPQGACTGICDPDANKLCPEGQICDDQCGRCKMTCGSDADCGPLQACGQSGACTIPLGTACGNSYSVVHECGEHMRCEQDQSSSGYQSFCQFYCVSTDDTKNCPPSYSCNYDEVCERR